MTTGSFILKYTIIYDVGGIIFIVAIHHNVVFRRDGNLKKKYTEHVISGGGSLHRTHIILNIYYNENDIKMLLSTGDCRLVII